MRDAVIVQAVRTPTARRNKALSHVHSVDLGARTLEALVERTGIDPGEVDDVIWGCVTTAGEQSSNIARWTALAAGWPESVPGITIDRACGSSQQALHFAAAGVMTGQYDVAVAGGVESMSRTPMGSTRPTGLGEARGPSIGRRYPGATFNQGLAAEMLVARWGLSREQLDEFSLESHRRANVARNAGHFSAEIVPVRGADGSTWVTEDEGIRDGGTLESMAQLAPAFLEGGAVTAASSSQIADGASAVLVMSQDKAESLGCRPLAKIRSFAVTGVNPELMLTGPIEATAECLRRAGLTTSDIGVFEVNEAFASVPLVWMRETDVDPARLNPRGGAIALGHPLGASGARICTTMLHHMLANDLQFGLQTICEAGGMANATILELVR